MPLKNCGVYLVRAILCISSLGKWLPHATSFVFLGMPPTLPCSLPRRPLQLCEGSQQDHSVASRPLSLLLSASRRGMRSRFYHRHHGFYSNSYTQVGRLRGGADAEAAAAGGDATDDKSDGVDSPTRTTAAAGEATGAIEAAGVASVATSTSIITNTAENNGQNSKESKRGWLFRVSEHDR